MQAPKSEILPASTIYEEMVARLLPYDDRNWNLEVMRAILDKDLEQLWGCRRSKSTLPVLQPETSRLESVICLNRWRKTWQRNADNMIKSRRDERERTEWSLLYLRLNRLVDVPPIDRHRDARDMLRGLLKDKYEFDDRKLPATRNPLPPLTTKRASTVTVVRKSTRPREDDTLSINASSMESGSEDRETGQLSKAKKRKLRRKTLEEARVRSPKECQLSPRHERAMQQREQRIRKDRREYGGAEEAKRHSIQKRRER